ncbi:MAG TPA: hypothetical protein VE860_26700 [Chthoniobacterales bacterium]|nr:hypothetical protein [Chthoniobacterales bacterium]
MSQTSAGQVVIGPEKAVKEFARKTWKLRSLPAGLITDAPGWKME